MVSASSRHHWIWIPAAVCIVIAVLSAGCAHKSTAPETGPVSPDAAKTISRIDAEVRDGATVVHVEGTGPEIWRDTDGRVTHFVSAMGTTGTIMGTSRYLKSMNPDIQIVGVQPMEGSSIPGIRRWPKEYLPKIFDPSRVDRIIDVSQQEAEETARVLAAREGIFAGISSGGAVAAALKLSELVEDAVIVSIVCDRGDRYLSTGVFPA